MRCIIVAGSLILGLPGLAGLARAEPPPGADPALAPWFQSLTQPGTRAPCCSIADCRTVQYRVRGGHFQAFIGDAFPRWSNAPHDWVDVPTSHVLHRMDNPTGEGVACRFQGQILCFIEGNGV